MVKPLETEVLIIGGGINGTAIARELSKYKIDVTLVEKEVDVSFGISKGSNGQVYTGLEMALSLALKKVAGTVSEEMEKAKERICDQGYRLWEQMFHELEIPYRVVGLMVIATNAEEFQKLNAMHKQYAKNYGLKILGKEEILSIEPNVTQEAIAGLYEPGHMMVHNPFDAVIALAENAKDNGIRILLNCEVSAITKGKGFQTVETSNGRIKTRFIVNASGRYVDKIAAMAGPCGFGFQCFRGHLLITDKNVGGIVNNVITTPPLPGIAKVVQPTVDGNLRLGTLYEETKDRFDHRTILSGMNEVMERARSLVPSLSPRDIITYFTGTRMFSNRDAAEYIIESPKENPKFISVGPGMPGFTPAPAIAKIVVERLENEGLQLVERRDFNPYRKNITRFSSLSNPQKADLIRREASYGHVLCRCEHVTEAEVVESIRRGATTLDGIKFRTRAGMGRCQGGFCGPQVVEILVRELNIPVTHVTKRGGKSRLLLYQTKELLKTHRRNRDDAAC